MPNNIRANQQKTPAAVKAALGIIKRSCELIQVPRLEGSLYRIGYGRAVVVPPVSVVETDEAAWLREKLLKYYHEEKASHPTYAGLTASIVARFERTYKGL